MYVYYTVAIEPPIFFYINPHHPIYFCLVCVDLWFV